MPRTRIAPPTAIDLAILAEAAEGAMSVEQACAFTGDSRARIYQLMAAGVLTWYSLDGQPGGHRRITRRSLIEYVARQIAAHTSGA